MMPLDLNESISLVATVICDVALMVLLVWYSKCSSWTRSHLIPYFYSVEERLIGSKVCCGREMDSCCYTKGWRPESSNGRVMSKKFETLLRSNTNGLWRAFLSNRKMLLNLLIQEKFYERYPQRRHCFQWFSTIFESGAFSIVSCFWMWYLDHMDTKYTEADLIKYDKEVIISLFLSMQKLVENLTLTCTEQKVQLEQVNQNMKLILEQLNISKQNQFGRSSEKMVYDGQLEICFNEAEAMIANKYVVEPEMEEVCPCSYTRKKKKGKRDEDLKDIPVVVINHELSDHQLRSRFGDKWKRLPDEVYKRLTFHPATFEVEEHHVFVYAGTDNQTIIRGERPVDLMRNSIVTPSLEAAIMNSKYVNAIPLYRLEQEFLRNDVKLSRQVMANWTIQCGERYLSLLYDRLHKEIYKSKVLQADETPVCVSKDGRPAGSKSYMWVYRTGKMQTEAPIVLYEYQKTRNTSHPREFLKKYSGTVVTDGYQVYHTLEKEREDLKIAGCWSHARRRFANVVKAVGKDKAKGTLAYDALKQIAAIYKIEGTLIELSPEERQRQRQLTVKPLVEAFFTWVKSHLEEALPKSETGKGFMYCLNQEKYLRVFLEDGNVPADNNAAESSIRGFCIGKHNWHLIDTIDGAKASAVIYSVAETAKANNLKPYNYFELLLTEIPKHMDDSTTDFLDDLLPWSEKLPAECRKLN